jgi:CBS domain-containing protein
MRHHTTVGEVMTREVVTVSEDTPYKQIAQVLAGHRISAVPVLDADGRVTGVVSESDLLRKEEFRIAAAAGWPGRLRRTERRARAKAAAVNARHLMSTPVITIPPTATLPQAARAMAARGITRLVVTDDGVLAGIVTRSDLLRRFLAGDGEILRRVHRDVVQHALWDDPFGIRVSVHDGVVTLSGELEQRSLVPVAERLTREVDGVVDVVNELSYVVDDTRDQATSTKRR